MPVLKYRDPVSGNWVALPATAWPSNEVVSWMLGPGSANTASTTYGDWPNAGGALAVTLNKRQASTLIIVDITVSGWTGATVQVNWGVRVDAAAAVNVVQTYFNVVGTHMQWTAKRAISGLSVGSHTFTLQAKVSSSSLACDGNDTYSMSVREVTA